MAFVTSHKSPTNINPALTALKRGMKETSNLLELLDIGGVSMHSHLDQSRIFERSIARFKIHVGKYDFEGRDLPIFAYLHREDQTPTRLFVVYYIFPHEYGMGTRIDITNHLEPATIDKRYALTSFRHDISVILRVYFILQGIELDEPVSLGRYFIQNVTRICKMLDKKNPASIKAGEQNQRPRTNDALLEIEENETAVEHKEIPEPPASIMKIERDSTPSLLTTIEETTATSPAVKQPSPPRYSPSNTTTPQPPISQSNLHTDFTIPMQSARTKQQTLTTKIATTKRKLSEHDAAIEDLWAQIAAADKKKLKLQGKIDNYEERREKAVAKQKMLVERLDPALRDFVKVAKAIELPEEEADGEDNEEEEKES